MQKKRECQHETCTSRAIGHFVAVRENGVPAFDKAAGYYCASHAKALRKTLAGTGCKLQRVRLLVVPADKSLEPQRGGI